MSGVDIIGKLERYVNGLTKKWRIQDCQSQHKAILNFSTTIDAWSKEPQSASTNDRSLQYSDKYKFPTVSAAFLK